MSQIIKYWKGVLKRKFRPLTVHTEAAVVNEVWEKTKEKINLNKIHTWYVMTPLNLPYFKSSFNMNLKENQLSKILIERYRYMLKKGQRLQLHIHLSMIMNMSYEEQEKLIVESKKWLEKELKIRVDEVVFGWWCYNQDTEKICKKIGLQIIKFEDYDSEHDYEWVFEPKL